MKHEDDTYTQFGMAAIIPGWQYAIDLLQQQLDAFRADLAARQQKPGSKPNTNSGALQYWARLTPKQRAAEMLRRGMTRTKHVSTSRKADTKAAPPTHPRDPLHPKHEEYLQKLRAGVRKRYKNMTPEQRKAQMASAIAARREKKSA